MKHTKNIFSLIVSVATLSSIQYAWSAPVVEIYNKTNESIQVDIADASSKKDITTAYVEPNQQWNSGDKPTITLNTKLLIQVSTKANPSPKAFIIENADEKTKYLSWDSAKSKPLYPQTGPLMGFGKMIGMKSKSGLSLDNNVKAENIVSTNPLATPAPTTKPTAVLPRTNSNFELMNYSNQSIGFYMKTPSGVHKKIIQGGSKENNMVDNSNIIYITIIPKLTSIDQLNNETYLEQSRYSYKIDARGKPLALTWEGQEQKPYTEYRLYPNPYISNNISATAIERTTFPYPQ